jgi:hypothetical protein
MARVDLSVEAGATLAEIFAQAQPDAVLRRHAHVFVGDHYIPRENWHRVRPKPGTTVSIRVVPSGGGGGGGKNPLRTILMIAVLAAAVVVPGAIFSAPFLATAGGALAAAGVSTAIPICGDFAVNQRHAP